MTQDIRPPWHSIVLNIVRRLQSVARGAQSGYAILTINVLVNADGNPAIFRGKPLIWTNPEVVKLEPQRAEVIQLLEDFRKSP